MTGTTPILLWLRRDFRLADHAALSAAAATRRPVIPVHILDEVAETHGAAPKWRLEQAIAHFAGVLDGIGSRLILRRGPARETLAALAAETGAGDVWWSRAYDPDAVARDRGVKSALTAKDLGAKSFPGHVLFEPWTVATGSGGYYKVFTPFWRAVREREVAAPLARVTKLAAPAAWPASDSLADWRLGAGMHRGGPVVARYANIGEAAAEGRLGGFIANDAETYKTARDALAASATSRLSENLTTGEISPAACWHAGLAARERGVAGAGAFLQELVWREFAYHLAWHTPRLISQNWRPEWDAFPWSQDHRSEAATRWCRGRTGVPVVDAAMRELYTTGYMHNRGRMITASYLTKHLLTHWKVGKAWFEDTLTDWDPASNALGWQWAAGSGPDATPYFRVFNPETQAKRFDPDRAYIRRWVAELADRPGRAAQDFFAATPRRWGLSPDADYPVPVVGVDEGRKRAMAAYENRSF